MNPKLFRWQCVRVCGNMHVQYLLAVLWSGSADIPLHNKSAVCLTIPSLCACELGGEVGDILLLSNTLWRVPLCEWRPYEITDTLWGLSESEDEHSPQVWAADDGGRKWALSNRLFFFLFLPNTAKWSHLARFCSHFNTDIVGRNCEIEKLVLFIHTMQYSEI